MIDVILDTIIPEDRELEMPSAATIGFDAYATTAGIAGMVDAYRALVEALVSKNGMPPFTVLDEEQRLSIINASRKADIRLFSGFVTHVFRAYYTNRDVLERIGNGSVPPFPDGNTMEEDDWSILAPVYERGPIFRPVEE